MAVARTGVESLQELLIDVRKDFGYRDATAGRVHGTAAPLICCCDPCWPVSCCVCPSGGRDGGEAVAACVALIAVAGIAAAGAYTASQASSAAVMARAGREASDIDATHYSEGAKLALTQLKTTLAHQLAARSVTTIAGMGSIVAIAFLMAAAIAAIISMRRPVTFNYTGVAIQGGYLMAGAVGVALLAHMYAYINKPTQTKFDSWEAVLKLPVASA